ncbi:efflux RND transporter periplasmic adaptor subunit [Ichthyobacterium seriolicida]|uniref:RND family efflux transporter MFP subunit n=1 Tax=Ichthyobacterium seriolicida TaxID=242600 RepID=A0A1J1DZ69_9FLAO|nr:efflux RND transporter periplasmic adaptor subunit [Ichthyobacterium seriolicida]BAV95210.1 RND family efflux transporter MFP subunit [Ichthyobacterium seriolicida]
MYNKNIITIWIFVIFSSCANKREVKPKESAIPKKTAATVFMAEKSNFEHYISIQANAESDQDILIYPESSGKIQSLNVREGQKVKKSDFLLKIKSDVLQSSIKELKANLNMATILFKKQSALWKKKIGTEMQYLKAKTDKNSLENRLQSLYDQLDMMTISSPFNGVVDEILVKKSQVISPQNPVMRVINLDEIYFKAQIPEIYINKVKIGNRVSIDIPGVEKPVKAKIKWVSNYINPSNRTFLVRVDVNNNSENIKINSSVILNINTVSLEDVISLPSHIIRQDFQGENYVFVVQENGKVQKRGVEVSLNYKDKLVIEEGIEQGEIIVDKGSHQLNEGDEIEIIK